jgi:hypothetical protein
MQLFFYKITARGRSLSNTSVAGFDTGVARKTRWVLFD